MTDELSYFGSTVVDMPRGNPSPKLAITMDPAVYADVVAAAKRDGVSVSAWITEAARRRVKIQRGLAAVAEWEAMAGPLTDGEMEAARERRRSRLERLRDG